MATIQQAIASNLNRIAQVGSAPVAAPQPSLPAGFSIPPANSAMGLPSRGALPPNLIVGSDFYTAAAAQFRFGQRSSAGPPPSAVSKSTTPQSLINKKLVSPIIGGGSKLSRYNKVNGTIVASSVTNGASSSQAFTVTGVESADTLLGYQWKTVQAKGVTVQAVRVTGNNQITIDFFNPTAGSLTPTGGSISLFLVQ
jgi:hypothetical protein